MKYTISNELNNITRTIGQLRAKCIELEMKAKIQEAHIKKFAEVYLILKELYDNDNINKKTINVAFQTMESLHRKIHEE